MRYLKRLDSTSLEADLRRIGDEGVRLLSQATPQDTGKTSMSWYYTLEPRRKGSAIVWHNRNVNRGANIALLIQYGHGTGTGAYIQGRDYINPAIRKAFDSLLSRVDEVVKSR